MRPRQAPGRCLAPLRFCHAEPVASPDPLARRLLARHPAQVAPELLGAVLTSRVASAGRPGEVVSLRITEVEAYGGVAEDPGSHAHRRLTERNATMFGPVGHLYVYFTYGMHWCANVVAHTEGTAGAVLLRAGEVVGGHATARERRPTARRDRDLARGPARLAAALGIDATLDGADLLSAGGAVRLDVPGPIVGQDPRVVRSGPRTGVAGAGATTPWRFWLDGEPTVSPHRPATPRRRARD